MISYPNSVCVCVCVRSWCVLHCPLYFSVLTLVFLVSSCWQCGERERALCAVVSRPLAASANTFPRWLIYLPADSKDVCVPSASMWAENKTAEWRQTSINLCLRAEQSGGSDPEQKFWRCEETETDKLMFSVKFLRKIFFQNVKECMSDVSAARSYLNTFVC